MHVKNLDHLQRNAEMLRDVVREAHRRTPDYNKPTACALYFDLCERTSRVRPEEMRWHYKANLLMLLTLFDEN
jgi:hypothetical protein